MRENDFNLIDQPWIRVRMADASSKEVSLMEALEQAHEIRALSGELPTQDAAILRLLLAVLHTVFSRVDEEGNEDPLEDADSEDDGLNRWQTLWECKQFPMMPIRTYLERVRDRFWLFDQEYPFYQAPEASAIAGRNTKGDLKCKAVKLNASLNQSENKDRIFLDRNGEEKDSLSFPEAARWLVHMVAYDDCAVKKSESYKAWEKKSKIKEEGSPGVGWLGKLGLVYAEGETLFETLLLNMVLLPDGEYVPYEKETPVWERDVPSVREREKVSCPKNMAELLTFPSRYVLLEREQNRVIGCYPVFGMYFEPGEAILEQMTRRRGSGDANHSPYEPLQHDRGKFLWQEFDSLFVCGKDGDDRRPGVVRWIERLQTAEDPAMDQNQVVQFRSVGIYYDSKKSSIEQIETDSLDIHSGLMSALGKEWRNVISRELSFTEQIAFAVGELARKIYTAKLGRAEDRSNKADPVAEAARQGRDRFYEMMDLPFRDWLRNIQIDSDPEEKKAEWRKRVLDTARQAGRRLAEQAGPAAYVGHYVEVEKKKAPRFYSSASAYESFLSRLNRIR